MGMIYRLDETSLLPLFVMKGMSNHTRTPT